MIEVPDILAACDVADQLAREADDLSPEQALTLLEAVEAAEGALKNAAAFLRARALSQMEQPILVGSTAYSKVMDVKMRPRQLLIRGAVIDAASRPDENGEVPTAHEAATSAAEMMAALYVSPSTVPKTGGLKAIGIPYDDALTEEHTGWKIKKTELP